MRSYPNGGPAFPFEGGDNNQMEPQPGMSLRDYFAAKAMQGLISAHDNEGAWTGATTSTAAEAYKMADAMIKAREESQ